MTSGWQVHSGGNSGGWQVHDIEWGHIVGDILDQTDLVDYLKDNYLKLDQTEPQYILNGSSVNLAEPEFTYTAGVLTRIDYPSGYYKAFTYNVDGTLASIDYNGEHTKTFTYASEILQSIATS